LKNWSLSSKKYGERDFMKALSRFGTNTLIILSVALIIGIGAWRIISTYGVFSHTWDETAHVACGMELLDRGTFTYELVTPPLARIATAIGPYLAGVRSFNQTDMWQEGDDILHAGNNYSRNLALARLGTLPFFLVVSVIVYVWGRTFFDKASAVAATLLFTTLPPVLAHAGLATTDMALTATVFSALFAFTLWLDSPTRSRTQLLGLTTGLAVLSKFSAILFLPACFVALSVFRLLVRRHAGHEPDAGRPKRLKTALISCLIAFLVIWAGYQFSIGSMKQASERPHQIIDRRIGTHGILHDLAYTLVEAPVIPAPELLRGVNAVRAHNEKGHLVYFMGEVRRHGWWYFFPVEFAVKTPLPFLLFAAVGLVSLIRKLFIDKDWRSLASAVCASTILLVCLPSNIDLGIRYILPVYPLLAIVAGVGATRLWSFGRSRVASRTFLALLLLWQIIAGVNAHPDYLPYANELAGSHPERIVAESDFDWGQDVKRLNTTLRRLGVKEVAVLIRGAGNVSRNLDAVARPLMAHEPVSGWVAISLTRIKYDGTDRAPYNGYAWLEAYQPVSLVGHTIRVYHIPALKDGEVSKAQKRDGRT
jgi:hypothetical protein